MIRMPADPLHYRLATRADIPHLGPLIEASIRGLQTNDYTPRQIEGAIGHALGLDTQLIADQTYFIATPSDDPATLAGCGGWSFRATLFGSDRGPNRIGAHLNPATDPAKIRAIFVHPAFARRGLGSFILEHCERAARAAGFRSAEMGSTLTGVPLYTLRGYRELDRLEVPLPNGDVLPVVRMNRFL
jgi:GNAT superfamily N-acetyltransferase